MQQSLHTCSCLSSVLIIRNDLIGLLHATIEGHGERQGWREVRWVIARCATGSAICHHLKHGVVGDVLIWVMNVQLGNKINRMSTNNGAPAQHKGPE